MFYRIKVNVIHLPSHMFIIAYLIVPGTVVARFLFHVFVVDWG